MACTLQTVMGVRRTMLTRPLQNESVLIQKIYTHFKKAPGTHKLGVLYVVDSVTRQWVEAARRAGQPAGSAAPDGTFAAGVNRVTELLPVLMTDIINNAPEDQKVRTRQTKQTRNRISHHPVWHMNPPVYGIDLWHRLLSHTLSPDLHIKLAGCYANSQLTYEPSL